MNPQSTTDRSAVAATTLCAENFERAQREIAYAYERVPFFRRHMEHAQLTPADIRRPDDLRRIPPTEKAHFRKNFPAGVLASGYSLKSQFVYRIQSSGTEGDRLISVVLSYVLAQRQETCLSVNPEFASLFQPGLRLRTARYAPPNCSDVECSNPNSTMEDRLLPDGTLVLPVYHDLLTTPSAMVNKAADEIAEYDPHFFYVDPTHMAFLVRLMQRAGRTPHRTEGFCMNASYTLCTRVARRQIREFFGPKVAFADTVAMSEFGYVALECPSGRLHLNTEDYYMELLREGRPAAPGEVAELYVTTLEDELSPHIRYRTGDLYRLSGQPCECGSQLPVIRAEGRAKNILYRGDGTIVTPRELDDAVGDAPWMDMYRMEQAAGGELSFRYLGNEGACPDAERALRARLAETLRQHDFHFSDTTYFPAERGGKFLSCVSAIASTRAFDGNSPN